MASYLQRNGLLDTGLLESVAVSTGDCSDGLPIQPIPGVLLPDIKVL